MGGLEVVWSHVLEGHGPEAEGSWPMEIDHLVQPLTLRRGRQVIIETHTTQILVLLLWSLTLCDVGKVLDFFGLIVMGSGFCIVVSKAPPPMLSPVILSAALGEHSNTLFSRKGRQVQILASH